ncbi:hypothetical protein MYX82_03185 [Acidobacteria bacterium AH-259-D05]|nr:hypothetical protein [Acidobacteria bacterium AH-259-D05]
MDLWEGTEPRTVVAVAAGVTFLWARFSSKKGRRRLMTYIPFSDYIDHYVSPLIAYPLNFIIFVVVGTYAAIVLADPETPRQGLAAGLAWTAFVTKR